MAEDILLLTGWGATCTAWEPIIPALTDGCQINCVIPSWHENSKIQGSLSDVECYVEKLAATISVPTDIVAWSMGGLLAIKLASRFPQLVKNICFISSVPMFVSENNENAGIDYQWFTQFINQYRAQPLVTLKKFLTLQVKNDASVRDCLRFLKKSCDFERYDLIECGYGLNLLQLDLSEELKRLKCKTFFIHGSFDAVVNLNSAKHAAYISNSPLSTISDAGHTPHISQPDEVARIIKSYLY
ncbi:MAG: alpha/beta fold hydrolase [Gammaproteobacteria bacterium]